MRTVTTPAAQAAARGLADELPGLTTTTADLRQHGGTLADPRYWEGPKAQAFRAQVWPDVEAALTTLGTSLDELARSVAEVNRRIADAGT
ncbi:pyrophosphorylase [Frankia sp. CNm7]|uniref:Pyrophosphorylase n=1 Tax=Frankia nepalensis TaxID=1836974 RepID=A0A937URN4_9ACTN|nr:pyrophosphorylase [Frankia nepalensis]MBL7498172.1 pyrophosphorylase [Frankia nepalensis]MBL7509310.1 pyrophosphorylase [Frankia nepalensis]MBL7524112.1 pyrophosphorylase [Frankia nepalensis]MBL7627961.1 pyrophosphorylase [Frankia nepalensis]